MSERPSPIAELLHTAWYCCAVLKLRKTDLVCVIRSVRLDVEDNRSTKGTQGKKTNETGGSVGQVLLANLFPQSENTEETQND